jgi:2-polyprenyl-3-methyl-5-hydroxy-6-metoxy-1,4-benzoquinol methylase
MAANLPEPVSLRSRAVPLCHVCGSTGRPLYTGITDRLFAAPGSWSLKQCADPACGLLWLDPVPIEEDIGKAYASYFTHAGMGPAPLASGGLRNAIRDASVARDYGYQVPPVPVSARLVAALLGLHPGIRDEMGFSVMWQPAVPGGRLLDVGCGSGVLIARLRALGWNAEGVDFDPAAAEVGARNGLLIRVGGIEAQHYPADTFDAVTMSHFIEHVHAPGTVLAEAIRVLKPGGTLTLVTPNAASLGHRWFKADWRPLEPPRHLQMFTPPALLRVLRDLGYVEGRARTTLCDPYGVFLGSLGLRRRGAFDMSKPITRFGKLLGRIYQLVETTARLVNPAACDELMIVARKPAGP